MRSFTLNLYALGICFINFVSQVRNHLVYRSFRTLVTLGRTLGSIPSRTVAVSDNLQDTVSTLSFSDTRELWWLERKLDLRAALKITRQLGLAATRISQKFYLAFVVSLSLLMLNSGAGFLTQTSTSVASNFLTERLSMPTSQEPSGFRGGVSINASAFGLEDQAPIVSILKHEVVEGDTLESLSNLYGISTDTIRYNNDVQEPLEVGSTVYLPWMNGYIYRTSAIATPQQIADIYGLDAAGIVQENQAILNPENNEIAADTLVLIPTTDFTKITETNDRIVAEKEAEEARAAEEARQAALARQSVSTVPANTAPVAPATGGFIWPTSGIISRCLQPGHVACDIANAAGPNIVAVQSGVVTSVYRFSVYGYGLAVVIDHGNGLQTLYAHMSDIYVAPGQQVSQGTPLGRMGCTGLCTGTHLHFEVKLGGVNQNPLAYLP